MITVKITRKEKGKWWNDFIGTTFDVTPSMYGKTKIIWAFFLTDEGLTKLNTIRPNKISHSALIHATCCKVLRIGHIKVTQDG